MTTPDPIAVPADKRGCVACIGVFDGVHRGHQSLVDMARRRADALGLPVVAITFDPHPDEVVRPGTHPPLLSTIDHRCALLAEIGADAVCVLPFTRELAAMSPEEFVDHVLVERFHAVAVVVGENFRFGHRASGDTETSRSSARPRVRRSTRAAAGGEGGVGRRPTCARWCAGDVAAPPTRWAARTASRAVVHGDHRGRELGYPTANLATTPHAALPADGVYAGRLVVAPYTEHTVAYPTAVSVGTNPTFDGVERRVEAYVLDRDDLDLYGAHVAVDFVARIRGQCVRRPEPSSPRWGRRRRHARRA
jgi:riboflavin kinase/FMN adenylyltransferase